MSPSLSQSIPDPRVADPYDGDHDHLRALIGAFPLTNPKWSAR